MDGYQSPEKPEGLTIQTDKESYTVGETITISGTTIKDVTLSIVIVDSKNNMVSIMNVQSNGGEYSYDYITNNKYGTGMFEIRLSEDSVNFEATTYELIE